MKKYCMSCGALNKNDAKFCKSCGAEQQFRNESYLSNFTSYFLHMHPLSYILLIPIVLCLILLYILVVPHGYEKALENYFEGIVQGDTDKFIDAVTFDELYDYIIDDRERWHEFKDELRLDERIQGINYSNCIIDSLCVEIISCTDYSSDEIEDFEDWLSNRLKQDINITDGKSIKLKLLITSLYNVSHPCEFVADAFLIKANGKWFVLELTDYYPFDTNGYPAFDYNYLT